MKWNQIAALVFGLAAASVFAQDKTDLKADLTGRVVNAGGEPVADASIFIYTAGPRVGPGYI